MVVLEVGGVGYSISIASNPRRGLNPGDEAFFHTAFIVREDAHLLFGFETAEELTIFDLLRSVTGVGPKSAQAVLASMSIAEIASAVVGDNDSAFRKVSGIGPKTAKLITLSLAGKLAGSVASASSSDSNRSDTDVTDRALSEATAAVIEALLGLGYHERVVTPVVEEVSRELVTVNRNELLRASLSRLGTSKAVSGGEDR